MKQAMSRAMRQGAEGVRVRVSGRLGGAEIARNRGLQRGESSSPYPDRADIDYGFLRKLTPRTAELALRCGFTRAMCFLRRLPLKEAGKNVTTKED